VSAILKQVEQRMAELDEQFGRRRRPLAPPSPYPRDNRLRRDVFAQLGLPDAIAARVASKKAFAAGRGSYASLLVCRTSAVVEAFCFEGVPGIRAALVDLAAFALVLADCVDALSTPTTKPRSTE
jgi:hypothetical protein